jgi:hypothetical protein
MKMAAFSKAHGTRERHSGGVDPDDPALFSHAAPSSADATRRERQGDGPCTSMFDERFYSNFGGAADVKPTNADRAIARDKEGHPVFSDNLSSGAMETADRIRRRER